MLKNYTSTVPADRSISYIEKTLAQHGASMIVKMYGDDGEVTAIAFEIECQGKKLAFRLPSQIEACARTLEANLPRRARPETVRRVAEQAARTAWKILADWVDAQMAMIDLAQVEMLEVFLPYAYDAVRRQTYFERVKEHGFRALLPAAPSDTSCSS
jgi:hypothetical protein